MLTSWLTLINHSIPFSDSSYSYHMATPPQKKDIRLDRWLMQWSTSCYWSMDNKLLTIVVFASSCCGAVCIVQWYSCLSLQKASDNSIQLSNQLQSKKKKLLPAHACPVHINSHVICVLRQLSMGGCCFWCGTKILVWMEIVLRISVDTVSRSRAILRRMNTACALYLPSICCDLCLTTFLCFCFSPVCTPKKNNLFEKVTPYLKNHRKFTVFQSPDSPLKHNRNYSSLHLYLV